MFLAKLCLATDTTIVPDFKLKTIAAHFVDKGVKKFEDKVKEQLTSIDRERVKLLNAMLKPHGISKAEIIKAKNDPTIE
ncbi:MAG: hypothetical protein ACRCXT_01690 [Paraclostridium sp.]